LWLLRRGLPKHAAPSCSSRSKHTRAATTNSKAATNSNPRRPLPRRPDKLFAKRIWPLPKVAAAARRQPSGAAPSPQIAQQVGLGLLLPPRRVLKPSRHRLQSLPLRAPTVLLGRHVAAQVAAGAFSLHAIARQGPEGPLGAQVGVGRGKRVPGAGGWWWS
jgi:hypothetical protein